jgi:MFS family permease
VWGLGITSLLTDISSEMVVSILPAYLVIAGGMTPLAIGFVTGLHEGGPLLAAWLGGWIADRSGRRKLTAAFGYGISAVCRVIWLTLPVRVVPVGSLIVGDRLGKAIRTAPRDAMISLSVANQQLATAFGVHRAMDAAGAAVGPVLAFVLLWQLPRRYDVVFFASLMAAALGLAALLLLVDMPAERRRESRGGERLWTEALAVFTDPSLRRVLVLAVAFGIGTVSDALLYLVLIQRSHAGTEWIPLLYTGTAIAFLTLAIPIGVVADRAGKQRTFILGHVPLLAAYAVVLGGVLPWPWSGVAAVGLLGAYYACCDGVLAGLASALLPTATRSVGLAWVATGVSIAKVTASVVFGYIWDYASDRTAVLVFAAALVVVGCIAWLTTVDVERRGII